jgi:hypothetical protein
MRKFAVSIIVAVVLSLSLVGTALANGKNLKKTLTLTEDVMVNNTLIKKGEYRVLFDAKTDEVTLSRDGDVVYRGKATVELRPMKASYNSAVFKNTDKGKRLDGFTFAGDRRAIVLTEATSSAADGGQ